MARAGTLGKILASGSPVAFTLAAAPAHRQNLFTYSDPTTVDGTTFPDNINVSAISSGYIPNPNGGYFNGGVAFSDNTVGRMAYKSMPGLSIGARYVISFYVLMGDGSAPSVGLDTVTGDFGIVARGNVCPNAATVTPVGSNVYRVSTHYHPAPSGDTSDNWGIVKFTGQSAKDFKVTGWQLEKVPAYNTTVGTYTPTGTTAEHGKYRLSTSTYRVMDATATVTVLEEGNGSKYSNAGSGAASGQVNDIAVHPSGNWIASVGASGLKAHAWSTASGFGSPCSSIPTLPDTGNFCAWSPDGAHLLVGTQSGARLYPFNATTGAFSADIMLSYGGAGFSGSVLAGVWRPTGLAFYVVSSDAPCMLGYAFSGSAITADFVPATNIPNAGRSIAVNPAGTRLIVGHAGTAANQTYMSMYLLASNSAIGALQTEPAVPPTAPVLALSVHPDGGHVAYADNSAAYLRGYVLTGGTAWGSALTALALDGVVNAGALKFSPAGNHVACGHANGNLISTVPFAGAYAAELAAPSTAAPGATGVGWSPDGKTLHVGGGSSAYHHAYQFSKASSETWTPNRLDGWVQAAAANYSRQGILVSSSYLPMTVFSEARAYSLKVGADALDSTAFQSTWKTFKQGLNQASGSLEAFRTTDTTLVASLTAKTPLALEFWDNTTDSSEPIARVRALAKGHGTDTSVADLVKEGFEFEAMADADNRVIAFPILAL